jgi:hypothetical protein
MPVPSVDVSEFHEAGGYMNVPPTELARMVKTEQDPEKRREMQRALDAWREVEGNPLARSAQRVARLWMASFVSL